MMEFYHLKSKRIRKIILGRRLFQTSQKKNEKRQDFKGATRKKERYVQNIRHIYFFNKILPLFSK